MRRIMYIISSLLILWAIFLITRSNDYEESVTKPVQTVTLAKQVVEPEPEPEPELNIMKVIATAYCPCKECSGPWGKSTATGAIAKEGRTIAVDPKVIPYGTEVIIDGTPYVAEDCGGAIKGNMIDIYFDNHEETELFGRKKIEIVISGKQN